MWSVVAGYATGVGVSVGGLYIGVEITWFPREGSLSGKRGASHVLACDGSGPMMSPRPRNSTMPFLEQSAFRRAGPIRRAAFSTAVSTACWGSPSRSTARRRHTPMAARSASPATAPRRSRPSTMPESRMAAKASRSRLAGVRAHSASSISRICATHSAIRSARCTEVERCARWRHVDSNGGQRDVATGVESGHCPPHQNTDSRQPLPGANDGRGEVWRARRRTRTSGSG
jgi:hypothetical protein